MPNILFIMPPYLSYEDYTRPPTNSRQIFKSDGKGYGDLVTDIPLGVVSLSAYIKKMATCDVHVKLIDFNVLLNHLDAFPYSTFVDYFNEVLTSKEIKEFLPDFIGLSVLFSPSYQSMLDIAGCCRSFYPSLLILAGGSVPSCMYVEILSIAATTSMRYASVKVKDLYLA